jgi:hypothetical protein
MQKKPARTTRDVNQLANAILQKKGAQLFSAK